MTTFTNDKAVAVKVAFKLDGKTYNNGTQEANAVDNDKTTHFPFDEVVVPAGKTVDLGKATIVATTDMIEGSAGSAKSFADYEKSNQAGALPNENVPETKKTKEVSKASEKSFADYEKGNQAG